MSTSDLAVAILKSRLPVTSGSIRVIAIELLDPENGGLAVGTESLSGVEADILVLPGRRPPSLKTDFRLHREVFAIRPLSCWTPKMLV